MIKILAIKSKKNNYGQVKADMILGSSDNIFQFNKLYDDLDKYLRKYGNSSSMHVIFKDKQDTITKNIKYIFRDSNNLITDMDRQRALIQKGLII